MSKAFFNDLGIPRPDVDLNVGSGSHAEQTGRVMVEFEKVCLREKPDLVIVMGDVNSTMACTITAKKLGIRVAHVEAGLRSGDMAMPEEITSQEFFLFAIVNKSQATLFESYLHVKPQQKSGSSMKGETL